MKALIDKVEFVKEYDTRHGKRFKFKVSFYDDTESIQYGFYSATKKDQNKFVPGQETEFELSTRDTPMGSETVIKPVYNFNGPRNTDYSKRQSQERARYSGFAASYVKDMMVAGILKPEFDEDPIVKEENQQVMETWSRRSAQIWKMLIQLDHKDPES